MLKPGDPAPPFDLPCCENDRLARLSLAAIKPEMVVVFFYPRDFSFICPTEIVGFSHQREAFDAEQAQLIGISTDSAESHRRWARELGAISVSIAGRRGRRCRERVRRVRPGRENRAAGNVHPQSRSHRGLLGCKFRQCRPQRQRDAPRRVRSALGTPLPGGLASGRRIRARRAEVLAGVGSP